MASAGWPLISMWFGLVPVQAIRTFTTSLCPLHAARPSTLLPCNELIELRLMELHASSFTISLQPLLAATQTAVRLLSLQMLESILLQISGSFIMPSSSAKKYLASDASPLRPDASDVAFAFPAPCVP